jgi:hypothetical protein
MIEVKEEVTPNAILMKVVDNKTGKTSYKIMKLNSDNENKKTYSEEEWEDLTPKDKKKWRIE